MDGAAFVFGDLLVRTEGVFAFSVSNMYFIYSREIEDNLKSSLFQIAPLYAKERGQFH